MKQSLLILCTTLLLLSAQAQENLAEPPVTNPITTTSVQEVVTLKGRVRERGTRKPLSFINVFILPHKLKATTDAEGNFVFDNVPHGEFQWVINQANYIKLEQTDHATPESSPNFRDLLLERVSYQIFETTVVGKNKSDDSVKSMRASQIANLPGAQGDPVKAVQNLPGINRTQGFSSQVIIQGSAPQDTRYLIDDHEVPLIFHFGGLTSVISPEAIDRVDYFSAGYGTEYGRAMGGQINLITKTPNQERWQSHYFVDTAKAGILTEGPLSDRSSLLLGARYSYIGFVLQNLFKENEALELTVVPSFGDFTSVYNYKISEKNEFKLTSVFSRDELGFALKEPAREDPSIRGNFTNQTYFYRLIPQYTHYHQNDMTSKLSAAIGQDWITVDIGDQYFRLKNFSYSIRGSHERSFSKNWNSKFGFDNLYNHAHVSAKVPSFFSQGGVSNPISTSEEVVADIYQKANYIGVYWKNELALGEKGFSILPSLRTDYFSLTKETLPAPRLGFRKKFSDSFSAYLASGLYYQAPQPQEINQDFGNPDLKSSRAWHLALSFEKDFRKNSNRGFVLQPGVFYRKFEKLVNSSSNYIVRDGNLVAEKFNNEGKGQAYGAEMLLRWDHNPWSGWVSYTISRSTRETPELGEYVYRYDQTHNLNLIASVDLPSNWKISGRFRYVTGNPYTPVTSGILDADNDVYVPIRGPIYSERLEAFYQLDLRFDKKLITDGMILSAYLDIQNVTNRQNTEAIRYSYDYTSQTKVTGLPIFPMLGIKGEF